MQIDSFFDPIEQSKFIKEFLKDNSNYLYLCIEDKYVRGDRIDKKVIFINLENNEILNDNIILIINEYLLKKESMKIDYYRTHWKHENQFIDFRYLYSKKTKNVDENWRYTEDAANFTILNSISTNLGNYMVSNDIDLFKLNWKNGIIKLFSELINKSPKIIDIFTERKGYKK